MKRIEKDFILKDLVHINNEITIKMEKLNSIISFFMEEEVNIIEDNIKEKNIKDFEEKQKVIQDDEDNNYDEDNTENTQDNNEINNIDETIKDNDELPNDIKTIYRKIVMITHPDKNINNHNLDLYSDYYKKVIKAKEDNDISEILYIAYKLNINDIYDIDDEYFIIIKNKINEIKNKSNTIDLNSFWVWYHTDNIQLKKLMVEQITKSTKNN